jgi:hypothetical protein
MRMGWLVTLVLVIVTTMPLIAVGQAQVRGPLGERLDCPLEKGWKPENLPGILAEHREWVARWENSNFSRRWAEDYPEGKANLCNADLSWAFLTEAVLSGAELTDARLDRADLTEAMLSRAVLIEADLTKARLDRADLSRAVLTGAVNTR